MVLSNIPEQPEHEDNVETTVNVTRTVDDLIHNVLGADDIKIVSANRVPISRKYGGSNTSIRKIMVKLESLNQRNKFLRIAKSCDMRRGGIMFSLILI